MTSATLSETTKANLIETGLLETLRIAITCLTLAALVLVGINMVANLIVSVSVGQTRQSIAWVANRVKTSVGEQGRSLPPVTAAQEHSLNVAS